MDKRAKRQCGRPSSGPAGHPPSLAATSIPGGEGKGQPRDSAARPCRPRCRRYPTGRWIRLHLRTNRGRSWVDYRRCAPLLGGRARSAARAATACAPPAPSAGSLIDACGRDGITACGDANKDRGNIVLPAGLANTAGLRPPAGKAEKQARRDMRSRHRLRAQRAGAQPRPRGREACVEGDLDARCTRRRAAYRKFKRPFRPVVVAQAPALSADRRSARGISASRGPSAPLSAAILCRFPTASRAYRKGSGASSAPVCPAWA